MIDPMPGIIRRALFEKLGELPSWLRFREDFAAATGLRIELVDELGHSAGSPGTGSPACGLIQSDPAGESLCRRFRQRLLERASKEGRLVTDCCDAGARETAVSLRVAGMQVGYLVFHGTWDEPPGTAALSRAMHLLGRAGAKVGREDLQMALSSVRVLPKRVLDAYCHWLQLAAREIAAALTDQANTPPDRLPAAVQKACGLIRSQAIDGTVSLPSIARQCGVSTGHLSRQFHRATGLTFTDYVARFRAEQARNFLETTDKNVTEAAMASGFNSLSQFHRVFRQVYGHSPREVRRHSRVAAAG